MTETEEILSSNFPLPEGNSCSFDNVIKSHLLFRVQTPSLLCPVKYDFSRSLKFEPTQSDRRTFFVFLFWEGGEGSDLGSFQWSKSQDSRSGSLKQLGIRY